MKFSYLVNLDAIMLLLPFSQNDLYLLVLHHSNLICVKTKSREICFVDKNCDFPGIHHSNKIQRKQACSD